MPTLTAERDDAMEWVRCTAGVSVSLTIQDDNRACLVLGSDLLDLDASQLDDLRALAYLLADPRVRAALRIT